MSRYGMAYPKINSTDMPMRGSLLVVALPCDPERVQSCSFDASLSFECSQWVLAHGLPDLPGPDLGIGQSVPVAHWIGPITAAMLHIRRFREAVDEQDVDGWGRDDHRDRPVLPCRRDLGRSGWRLG